MINKPRLPEKSASNLFRIALLLALAPSCATSSATQRLIEKTIAQKPDVAMGLNVDYSYDLHVEDGVLRSNNEDINEDIPPSTTQPMEVDFSEASIRITDLEKGKKDYQRIEKTIKTNPIDQNLSNCESKQIEGFQEGGNANTVKFMHNEYNILYLVELLQTYYPVYIKSIYESESRYDSVKGHSKTGIDAFASVSKFKTIVGPVNIQRLPNGVRTSTSIIRCKDQAEIASSIRSKLAKGTKTSHRK